MPLSRSPSPADLRLRLQTITRLVATARKATTRPSEVAGLDHAARDLAHAEELLERSGAENQAHVLRAVNTYIDIAEWRLRGVQALIELDKGDD